MKKTIIIICALCLFVASANAQNKTSAPANIKAAFQKEYAGALNVKWEKEHGRYEVNFTFDTQKMSVTYNTDGSKEETETAIQASQLPEKAQKTARAKGEIKDAASIIKADGTHLFEAEVNRKDLIFDKDGNFIKETKD